MSRVISVGDSHSKAFMLIPRVMHHWVDGATNMGLKNPHSKTNTRLKVTEYLENNLKKEDTLIFLIGEVDCGFVIWYRAEKYGDTIESQFNESINNYFDFIMLYKDKCKQICICDVPPPTIGDNDKIKGDVANKRMGIKATLKERTDLTLKYNKEISNFCNKNNFVHISYTKEILNENGVVDSKYKNKDPKDHHLDIFEYSKILKRKLQDANIIKK